MNSFWIPQLGSQIYAMTGMVTTVNLVADTPGTYQGLSANYSGDGFAGMRFVVEAIEPAAFDAWVAALGQAPTELGINEYKVLAKPDALQAPRYYGSVAPHLFDDIVMQFMDAAAPLSHTH
jgi:cytochrome o ubiquinol oxidase subunit 2